MTAFTSICDLIENKSFRVKESLDCDIYVCALKDTKHPTSGYRAEKVKRKLQKYLLA